MNTESFKSSTEKEKADEHVFRAYMEDLRLSPEDFEKKILDVGAGSAQFAKWAKEHGVSEKIYSLEPEAARLEEKEKSAAGKAEALPFADNSFDIVVSESAIPHIFIGEAPGTVEEKVEKSLKEMIRMLRPEGEIRLARVLMGKKYESQRIIAESFERALQKLEEEYGLEVKRERMPYADTYEYSGDSNTKELLAEAFLITIKKPMNTQKNPTTARS